MSWASAMSSSEPGWPWSASGYFASSTSTVRPRGRNVTRYTVTIALHALQILRSPRTAGPQPRDVLRLALQILRAPARERAAERRVHHQLGQVLGDPVQLGRRVADQ